MLRFIQLMAPKPYIYQLWSQKDLRASLLDMLIPKKGKQTKSIRSTSKKYGIGKTTLIRYQKLVKKVKLETKGKSYTEAINELTPLQMGGQHHLTNVQEQILFEFIVGAQDRGIPTYEHQVIQYARSIDKKRINTLKTTSYHRSRAGWLDLKEDARSSDLESLLQ